MIHTRVKKMTPEEEEQFEKVPGFERQAALDAYDIHRQERIVDGEILFHSSAECWVAAWNTRAKRE